MYYPYFITYITVGFAIAFAVFLWALKSGQFTDQQRARFLPLEDEPALQNRPVSRFNRYEAYVLLFLVFCGLLTSGAVLVFSFLNSG